MSALAEYPANSGELFSGFSDFRAVRLYKYVSPYENPWKICHITTSSIGSTKVNVIPFPETLQSLITLSPPEMKLRENI